MENNNKSQIGTAIAVLIVIGLIAYAYISISNKVYKPEDLSSTPIIDTMTLDECTAYNNQELITQKTLLQTKPGSEAGSDWLPSCNKIPLDVYQVDEFEGELWALVRVGEPFNKGDEQGWVKKDAMIKLEQ